MSYTKALAVNTLMVLMRRLLKHSLVRPLLFLFLHMDLIAIVIVALAKALTDEAMRDAVKEEWEELVQGAGDVGQQLSSFLRTGPALLVLLFVVLIAFP